MPEKDKTKEMRRKKKLSRAVSMLVVILVAAALNIFVSKKDYSIDVSEKQIYTLSDVTRNLLRETDRDVTIYVMGEEQETDVTYRKILEQYEAGSGKIHLRYCARNSWDQITSRYGVQETNIEKDSILVAGGERSRFISSGDYVTYDYTDDHSYEAKEIILERLASEALRYVISPDKTAICFLKNHGERETDSNLVNVLEGKGYKVSDLDLGVVDQVPEDCSVLVINGPAGELEGTTLRKIKNYMDSGGKLYIFLDPLIEKQTSMKRLLALYGLEPQKGVVIEKDSDHFSRYEIYLIPEIQDTEITSGLIRKGDKILLPTARGIKTVSKDSGTPVEGDYQLVLYLASSKTAYSKVDLDSSNTDKEKKDIGGPFALSVGVDDESGGRLIVTGCVNMLDENVNRASGGANLDFVVNGLEYLSRKEGNLVIPGKEIAETDTRVPAFDQKMILVLLVFLLPALILAAGVTVVQKRKRQ